MTPEALWALAMGPGSGDVGRIPPYHYCCTQFTPHYPSLTPACLPRLVAAANEVVKSTILGSVLRGVPATPPSPSNEIKVPIISSTVLSPSPLLFLVSRTLTKRAHSTCPQVPLLGPLSFGFDILLSAVTRCYLLLSQDPYTHPYTSTHSLHRFQDGRGRCLCNGQYCCSSLIIYLQC